MVCTGFSAVIGSWKIMPMRLPRSGTARCIGLAHQLLAVEADAAGDFGRCSGSRPISAMTVMDLPQPDSPIRPSVSPRSSEKLTPRTASGRAALGLQAHR
jgi:hypothetical protein